MVGIELAAKILFRSIGILKKLRWCKKLQSALEWLRSKRKALNKKSRTSAAFGSPLFLVERG